MGMTVKEYDCISFYDLNLKIEGFNDRLLYEENIFRNVAYSSYIGSHLDPKKLPKTVDKFWPMRKTDEKKGKVITDDKRERIKAGIQKQKEQHGKV